MQTSWKTKVHGGVTKCIIPEIDDEYLCISFMELATPVNTCPEVLPITLTVDDEKSVIATLTPEVHHISLNLKFATQIRLYHRFKDLDVLVCGYFAKKAGYSPNQKGEYSTKQFLS
ncbi:hypothetical protein POM88_037322 [Heracleum sosnowskyi]|uniref:Uncharacterized protein n=1 Tax=Heracleum sosnowskyi TaxID=360622 RepID=A0AAD8HSC3_9APIA|nr:hypothetical protein POM88_037322 [Heracleum sosnowskyi]